MLAKSARFRLYTELKDTEGIKSVLDQIFSGYTLFPAKGCWNGQSESTLVIEIIGPGNDSTSSKVRQAAEAIKILNNQEAVFVTREIVESELI